VQLSIIEATSSGTTMTAKYTAVSELIETTLRSYQIMAHAGSVAGAYCPGAYDLAVAGRKIAGMAQNWFRNRCGTRCIVTAASINIEEPPETLAAVVNQFYARAGSPLRCQAAALTNVRMCSATTHLAGRDLTAAVMKQLGAGAGE
jgi:lipoate-protein ligase A